MKTDKLKLQLTASTKSIAPTDVPTLYGRVKGVFVTLADASKLPNDIVELSITDNNGKPYLSMDIREFQRRQGGGFHDSYVPLNMESTPLRAEVRTATAPTADVVFEVVFITENQC